MDSSKNPCRETQNKTMKTLLIQSPKATAGDFWLWEYKYSSMLQLRVLFRLLPKHRMRQSQPEEFLV